MHLVCIERATHDEQVTAAVMKNTSPHPYLFTINLFDMTAIIAMVFLAGIIISTSIFVILIGHYRQHRKTEEMLRVLKDVSVEFNLTISKQDQLGYRIIGLDETNRNLVFLTKHHDGYIIDLDDIKTSAIKIEYGLVFEGYARRKGAKTAAKKVGLELIYWNGSSPLVLSFYDEENNEGLTRQHAVEMAEKWQQSLLEILAKHGNTTQKILATHIL